MNDSIEIIAENELSNRITSEESVKLSKNQTPKIPKQDNEILMLEDIVDDLRYLTKGYPTAAIKAALEKQDEITPFLFEFINHALENYQQLDEFYFGHLHAMFLLAYFREKTAFPLVIQMASLPEEWPENLLGDTITEDLDRVIASLYDGNITLIQQLIENENANTWSRNAALRSLLVLIKNNKLERTWGIDYFKHLFHHTTFMYDEEAITHLVSVVSDLYPEELYDEIKNAFENGQVDTFHINMKWINFVLAKGKEKALAEFIYENKRYDFIDDVIKHMQGWACFHERESDCEGIKDQVETYFSDLLNKLESEMPHRLEAPKIGRNESCPCGSGKKYKKCCLL